MAAEAKAPATQKGANPPRPSHVTQEGELRGSVALPGRAPAAGEEVTDEELFRRGDRESLAALVQRYEAGLFALLLHVTKGDASLADDLFQETFLRAVRAASTFDATKSFRTWVNAIALNAARDEMRKRKLRAEVLLDDDRLPEAGNQTVEPGPSVAERDDETRRLRQALARLTDKEREIILLHFYQGLTLAQAAEALEIPVGTGKSRLHSALSRLKDVLSRAPTGA